MRDFITIERELGLQPFLQSEPGDLYFTPVTAERPPPATIVRRFPPTIPARLVRAWAELTAAADAWLAADPELAALVRVAQPTEVGVDFVARERVDGTSLAAIAEGDAGPAPDELAPLQARFRVRAAAAIGDDALLARILGRGILEPTYKTVYVPADEGFVIAELKLTVDDLLAWAQRTPPP